MAIIRITLDFMISTLSFDSDVTTAKRNRITIFSNVCPNRRTWFHIRSECLHSCRTFIPIGSAMPPIAPVVPKTRRLGGQSAGVAAKVDAITAHQDWLGPKVDRLGEQIA